MYLIEVIPGNDENSWTAEVFQVQEGEDKVVLGDGDQRHIEGGAEVTWLARSEGQLHGALMSVVEPLQLHEQASHEAPEVTGDEQEEDNESD